MRVPSPTTTAENILFIGWKVPVYPKCSIVTSISIFEPGFPVNVNSNPLSIDIDLERTALVLVHSDALSQAPL